MRLVTSAAPRLRAQAWFFDGLHVSIGAKTAAEVVEPRPAPEWALGFPGHSRGVWLWAGDAVRAAVGDPPEIRYPSASPELEPLVEAVGKVRRAEDTIELRVAARTVGEHAVRSLRGLSPERVVVNRADAVRAALDLVVAPDGWRGDLAVLLGLVPADDARTLAAAARLARGTFALLREQAPGIDPRPELARALADGTLERHLGFG